MVKINEKLVDWWTLPHFIAGFLFGKYRMLDVLQFTILNAGFEIGEHVLKQHYDIFNVPFGRESIYESSGNSVMDFIITQTGYLIGLSSNIEHKTIKPGSLYARQTHEYLAFYASSQIFQEEIANILADNANLPDYEDWFLDRFWKHMYDVSSNSGLAPYSCDRAYKISINNQNYIWLARASHYLMDIGCVFHTSFSYQEYHLFYEQWVDENLTDIIALIGTINPIVIVDVKQSTIDLAIETHMYLEQIVSLLQSHDYDALKQITATILGAVTSYLIGIYNKYVEDVANNVFYEIPPDIGLNTSAAIGLSFLAPVMIYKQRG